MRKFQVNIYTVHPDIELSMVMDEHMVDELKQSFATSAPEEILHIEDDTKDNFWMMEKKLIRALQVELIENEMD
jgi:hypothetical protein